MTASNTPENGSEKTDEDLKTIKKVLKPGKDDLEDERADSINEDERRDTDEEKSKIDTREVCFIALLILAVLVAIYLLNGSQNWALTLWVGFFKLCVFAILAKKWNVTVFSDLVDKVIQVAGRNTNPK